eukprot:414057-Pelagomonas_calceolata.AAC.2
MNPTGKQAGSRGSRPMTGASEENGLSPRNKELQSHTAEVAVPYFLCSIVILLFLIFNFGCTPC